MNCPVCDNVKMREVDKDGVIIDLCPQCKGVWLDRGELDKLMSGVKEMREDFSQWHRERYNEDHKENYYKDSTPYKGKKKKSFFDRIEDIFD